MEKDGRTAQSGFTASFAVLFSVLLIGFMEERRLVHRKKNECMFEKMLGKRVKTRYHYSINSKGCEHIVRPSCRA